MRSPPPTPVPRRRALGFSVVMVLTALVGLSSPTNPTGADPGGPIAVIEAPPLTWGFKLSWRNYAGEPTVADGAAIAPTGGTYDITWPLASGTFDPTTSTTVLRYRGTVRWTKYLLRDHPGFAPAGYTGPLDVHVLDVTVSDPVVTISRDRADITVDAVSRSQETMALSEYLDSSVIDLDVSATTPTVAGGTTTWPGIPASLTGDAAPIFGDGYRKGAAVDPVGFSYTGPGGAPDFSEAWDAPGTALLEQTGNLITVDGPGDSGIATATIQPWWVDEANLVVHYRWRRAISGAPTWIYQAFDLQDLAPIGEPLLVPHAQRLLETGLWDRSTGRFFYTLPAESGQGVHRWIRFDREAGRYVVGETAPLPPGFSYLWDEVRGGAYRIERFRPDGVGPTDYDHHVWRVVTHRETSDGWEDAVYTLPNFGPGLNQGGINFDPSLLTPSSLVMADGTIIVLGTFQPSDDPEVAAPATVPAAWRITLEQDGTADRQPVAGATIANALDDRFTTLEPGPGGRVTLLVAIGRVKLQHTYPGSGEAEPPVLLEDVVDTQTSHAIAVDPTDGMVWIGGHQSQKLWGVKDGRVVSEQYFPLRHPRGGPVAVGPDHTVYAQTFDGSDIGFGGSTVFGFGRFERIGLSPTVTGAPADVAVSLGVGEVSEEVTFSSSATGDPSPERRWQVKAPGSARFVDIEGETGETLTATATPGMNGGQYRALFTNAAGRRASDPATLTVEHAPIVSVQPQDVGVVAGADAQIGTVVSGAPEPEVTWQRHAAGFWWNIGPDDDGFALAGGSLTVTDTNLDQDGTFFRARIRNAVGTVHTRVATLSVIEQTDGPQDVVDGELSWGVRQSFRTYITGPIAHGSIATSAGVTTAADGTFTFPSATGTLDGHAFDAAFTGAVRFTGHASADGAGAPALDVRMTDLRVEADGQDGTLVADLTSRGLEDGELTVYDDVPFATLDLSGTSPAPLEDGLRWRSVPATLTEQGAPAFADFYEPGSPLDPVTITLRLTGGGPAPERTATESFVAAALTDLLGTEPTSLQVDAGVTAVEGVGKTAFLRSLATSDQWLAAIVDGLYADTLGRTPSAADRTFWAGRIRAGWSVARVAAFFSSSVEYYGRSGGTDATWVASLYTDLLGRSADAPGAAYWVDQTSTRGRGTVALRFYQSAESARARVTGLYRHLLERSPDPEGLAYWAPQVIRHGDLALAVALASSGEYQARAEVRYP